MSCWIEEPDPTCTEHGRHITNCSNIHADQVKKLELQNQELKAELEHQLELWALAIPPLNMMDDRAGMVPFSSVHDPMGTIRKALGPVVEKRNRVCGFWTAGRPCVEQEPCPKHGTMPTNRI